MTNICFNYIISGEYIIDIKNDNDINVDINYLYRYIKEYLIDNNIVLLYENKILLHDNSINIINCIDTIDIYVMMKKNNDMYYCSKFCFINC